MVEIPSNAASIADGAVEEAAQVVMQDDVPLALVPELLAALQGPGMRAVMAMRVEQIGRHGHTIENDDMLPIGWLPMEARKAFERSREMMHGEARDLSAMRAMLVEGVALGLAAIDRLDRAIKTGER